MPAGAAPPSADAVRQSSSMVFNWVCLRGSGKGEAPRYLSIQAKKKDGCQVQVRDARLQAGMCTIVLRR